MGSYIHLIRHGITEANQKKLFYGATDIPLSEEGVQEIVHLRNEKIYPAAEGADCYVSKLVRTQETFSLIYGQRNFRVLPDFHEMQFGEYEMKSPLELVEDPYYIKWIEDKSKSMGPPGGESLLQFRTRINKAFQNLVAYHRLKELSVRHNGKDAVSIVVCHGGVISSILMDIFPETHKNMWKWTPNPGRGYTLKISGGKTEDYTKI